VRKHVTLNAQKFEMRCVVLWHAAAVRTKLKAMSKPVAIPLCLPCFLNSDTVL
jgi:hypothetical protein